MSSGRKTVTAFLTVIGALLLVILGLSVHWPRWAWAASAAVLVAVPLTATAVWGRRRDPIPRELTLEPDLPLPPLERREQRVRNVALPSDTEDYDFLFSATVRWYPNDVPSGAPLVNPGALAVDAVLGRARNITATRAPNRCTLVQHELNGDLGVMLLDSTGRVHAMAEDVVLTLTEQDRERLGKLSAVRKDEAVWEHERKHEQNKRAYLGEDVLKNTGSAVVWWLAKNDDKIDKAVADLGLLAQLSSAANNQDIPDHLRHLVPRPPADPEEDRGLSAADHFAEMLRAMGLGADDPRCALFVQRVVRAAAAADRTATAEDLRQRFAPAGSSEDGEEAPSGAAGAASAA
ncbi:hypothetical protein [Streptomyces caatingaensis]|uniref:Uncharacterized protein n=1 Tax=Streptomyces caatingaensis TaxID=1678637 RepID=A0A0K9X9U5_9ACTN|nr:hypothetical protein [Streptomyces caatingaensis]KNB49876.1 hypothetical protein AC230_24315 [Streptomyces caatingaensis]